MEWIRKHLWILVLSGILLIVGCEESPTESEDSDVVPKQSRKLGYHITPAAGQEYEGAVDVAMDLNMQVLPFTMVWNEFDTTTGYNHELLTIMNVFYPAYDLPLSLNITPIHAVNRAFPEGLESYSFSSDTVISRFTTFLDTVHAAIPDVELNNILFGNEPDLYFMSHEDEWDDFASFYAAAAAHAKSLWGDDVPIGVEATFAGLTGEFESEMRAVNQHSDIIAFTYYPLNSDFTMQDPAVFGPMLDAVATAYPTKSLFLEETGYATSSVCEGTEEKQAEYVSEIFQAWDKHADRLTFVGLLWLHDLSQAEAEAFVGPYGMTGAAGMDTFTEYLRSLGLYNFDGSEKVVIDRLNQDMSVRGW